MGVTIWSRPPVCATVVVFERGPCMNPVAMPVAEPAVPVVGLTTVTVPSVHGAPATDTQTAFHQTGTGGYVQSQLPAQ